jgi:hypothetical protein
MTCQWKESNVLVLFSGRSFEFVSIYLLTWVFLDFTFCNTGYTFTNGNWQTKAKRYLISTMPFINQFNKRWLHRRFKCLPVLAALVPIEDHVSKTQLLHLFCLAPPNSSFYARLLTSAIILSFSDCLPKLFELLCHL